MKVFAILVSKQGSERYVLELCGDQELAEHRLDQFLRINELDLPTSDPPAWGEVQSYYVVS